MENNPTSTATVTVDTDKGAVVSDQRSWEMTSHGQRLHQNVFEFAARASDKPFQGRFSMHSTRDAALNFLSRVQEEFPELEVIFQESAGGNNQSFESRNVIFASNSLVFMVEDILSFSSIEGSSEVDLGDDDWFDVRFAASTADQATQIEEFLTRIKTPNPPEIEGIQMHFWELSTYGPNCRARDLSTSNMDDIRPNYTAEVNKKIDKLVEVDSKMENVAGKLMLWYGPPGTGKTHMIRALADQWSSWCDFHYIVDHEKFFREASYMNQVVFGASDDTDEKRWSLLIIEDAAELISGEAYKESGPGLSKLLNLTEGMIGQGLNVMVLITTNESIEDLHPAVKRPGRCMSEIEFGELNKQEAEQLAEGMDINPKSLGMSDEDTISLAEMFTLRNA